MLFPAASGSVNDDGMPTTIEGVRGKTDYFDTKSPSGRERAASDDCKLLDAFRHSKVYRDYERIFTQATGLPLALRPVEFFGLPLYGKKNENPFCAFLAERKSSCVQCLRTQSCLTKSRGPNSHSIQCAYGLTETAIPIVLGERVIGFLCTGQVFTAPPKIGTRKAPDLRRSASASGLTSEALRLWKQTRFIEPVRYKATVQLLGFFAKQLSTLSNQLCIEQKSREPAVVARARQFIAENKGSPFTLAAVAQASGSSMFHFCKLFRVTTGVKFTEYVARTRVEHARELLCNRQLRMCEVAYEAGFQSLTAFHRAFQRVLGQSPTEYRIALNRS